MRECRLSTKEADVPRIWSLGALPETFPVAWVDAVLNAMLSHAEPC